jgi:hypothetical protein
MKISISRERLFDPRLRAFVARREYIEAMRYYRGQYQANRDEASDAIDFVREQLERERDSGAAPATIAEWSHPITAPQSDEKKVAYAASIDVQSEEEEEETSEAQEEELSEEYDDPDENLNSSPYELPGSFGRPELERVYQKEKARNNEEKKLSEEDEEEVDDADVPEDDDDEADDIEEDIEDDDIEDDDDIEEQEDDDLLDDEELDEDLEEDEETPEPLEEPPSVPTPEPSPPPASEAPVDPPKPEEPIAPPTPEPPIASVVSRRPVFDEPPAGLPSWGGLSASMRRELLSLESQDAIRLYWSEVGCSLSEAKSYVLYWRMKEGGQ